MLIFTFLENYRREFICSRLRLKAWVLTHTFMFVCMYISCYTLGSLERSFLTLENYCNHLSGHLKVQSVYLCLKKNAMNCTLLRQNRLWLEMSFNYSFMQLLLSIVNLFLVVYYRMKGSDCICGGRGCNGASILARLIHSCKQHLLLPLYYLLETVLVYIGCQSHLWYSCLCNFAKDGILGFILI